MAKQIDYGQDAFVKLLAGAKKISDAVAVTLGAKGQNVLIEGLYENDAPHITKDGVTVAKAVQLKDPVERIAANLVRKVASRTNEIAGDGTTTATVLANAILQYGAEALKEGHNAVMLKRGIDNELVTTIQYLEAMKTPLNDNMEIAHEVALISANGDEKIAKIVTDVYSEVGKEGNIAIEMDINSPDISYTKVEGLEIDSGFNHPYYVTDIPSESVEYTDALVLVSDYKVLSIRELKNVLELAQNLGRPLLLIAEDLDIEAENMLAVNKLRNGFPIVTINAPEFGDRRLDALQDIAIITGGQFISTITGKSYDDVVESDFGRVERLVVSRNTTSLIGGKGNKEEIKERLDSILQRAEGVDQEDYKKHLLKRHAKLVGGVCVIKVGGNSEIERAEVKDRVEDAVNAVKSSLIDGIIPGGGAPLLRISLTPLNKVENEKEAITRGRQVLKSALKIPFNQVLNNAGYDDLQEIASEVIDKGEKYVFDVYSEEIVDGIEKGIIDPVLVTKTAVTNAASIAGTLLTTGCTISFEPDNGDSTLKL